ncbi:hypothetical protein PsorP6_014928 [Peronosclerospora sorghi]|uniref:Uncharacterized protein n=1 Tax=Peronosclerospora sorghi TaxID=230839 RepID=A0ACC0VUS5_9STRA|nr:hypothetical protein PsorP6_014928 [Peronosclerospora sorghi]
MATRRDSMDAPLVPSSLALARGALDDIAPVLAAFRAAASRLRRMMSANPPVPLDDELLARRLGPFGFLLLVASRGGAVLRKWPPDWIAAIMAPIPPSLAARVGALDEARGALGLLLLPEANSVFSTVSTFLSFVPCWI